MPRIWDDLIGSDVQEAYRRAGFGRSGGFGRRPALLLIDLYVTDIPLNGQGQRDFSDPLPRGAAINLDAIRALTAATRASRFPIFYTNMKFEPDGRDVGGPLRKNRVSTALAKQLAGQPYPWLDGVAPDPEDWVIYKHRPSAFFGTPLASHFIDLGVDTVIVGGQTTSGCVRATVLDSFSYGFRTIVPEECTYDRCAPCHKVNLFDMHQKYADVLPLTDVLAKIDALTATAGSPTA
jgi:maleamate amidohydrolase